MRRYWYARKAYPTQLRFDYRDADAVLTGRAALAFGFFEVDLPLFLSRDDFELLLASDWVSLLLSRGCATSKKPIIISSYVCSPKPTFALGSGFDALLGELSNPRLAANLGSPWAASAARPARSCSAN